MSSHGLEKVRKIKSILRKEEIIVIYFNFRQAIFKFSIIHCLKLGNV